MWSKKRLVGAFAALVTLCIVDWFLYQYAVDVGIKRGIDSYHQMCYTIGGIVVDEQGHVVVCRGLGQMPEAEVKKFLQPT